MKKESTDPKKNCGDKFKDNSDKIAMIEREGIARKERIRELEINYGHILTKIGSIEGDIKEMKTAAVKNAAMTTQIYAWMAERKQGGKRGK